MLRFEAFGLQLIVRKVLVLFLSSAGYLQLELQTILCCKLIVLFSILKMFALDAKRQQSDSMNEQFVRQHRCILVQQHLVKSHCRNLRDYDSPQGVWNRGIHTFELHLHRILGLVGNLNWETLLELSKVKDILAWTWFIDLLFVEFNYFLVTHLNNDLLLINYKLNYYQTL